MKQFDAYNTKAREKANDQPCYKKVVEFERACPYCDVLARVYDDSLAYLCSCGKWVFDWKTGKLEYQPKSKAGDVE